MVVNWRRITKKKDTEEKGNLKKLLRKITRYFEEKGKYEIFVPTH